MSNDVVNNQGMLLNQQQDLNGHALPQVPGNQYNQSQQAYVNSGPVTTQMLPPSIPERDVNVQYTANQAQYMYQGNTATSNSQVQQSANSVQYQAPAAPQPSSTNTQTPTPQLSFGGKYLPKPWHTDEPEMKVVRENMCGIIVQLLQQRRPEANADWREKLPQMSKRLEDALYHAANTLEEYNDEKTLKTRLQQLALQMGTSKSSNRSSSASAKGQNGQQLPQNIANVPVQKSNNGQWNGGQNPQQEEHRRQILKQQQQRLLLLRHASKCQYENGTCVVSSYCGSMKTLWKHIVSCKDQECKTKHCVSSRYVLSHYSKCRDANCPVCAPVREAIRRNFEKSKQVVGHGHPGYGDEPAGKRQKLSKEEIEAANAKRVLDPISCAVYCFTNEQIKTHLKAIHEGMKGHIASMRDNFLPVVDDALKVQRIGNIFGAPVDPVLYNLPDYFDIIKRPMDLGTVRRNIDTGLYRDAAQLFADINLTFDNAMLYNPKGSDIYNLAQQTKKQMEQKIKEIDHKTGAFLEKARRSEDHCIVCGTNGKKATDKIPSQDLKFEPPVYYCNGNKCQGQRIKRNQYYYSAYHDQYHWCVPCFQELRENQPIKLVECTITKKEIASNKNRHDKEIIESWVCCDGCESWVHWVCALFNGRRNVDNNVYLCINCLMKDRERKGEDVSPVMLSKKLRAKDIPLSTLSNFIEKSLAKRLEKAYQETADRLGVSVESVEKCPPICVRLIASYDKNQHTKEQIYNRYKHRNFPAEFPCRVKCLVLFQEIDGEDVLLYCMYVYEYGHKCPQPNQRRVYISYLDSVFYFRPRQYRTIVYHEMLISYLEYVKRRGFHTCHIWACPPGKGDDYIFYCHPQEQKTPKPDKLTNWYIEMLNSAKERGVVSEITSLYEYFLGENASSTTDASDLPYFDGDYWINQAEDIIKELKGPDKKLITAGSSGSLDNVEEEATEMTSKNKSKAKAKASRPERSTRYNSRSGLLNDPERDPVIVKLAQIMSQMKEGKEVFIVARLHPQEYADKWAQIRKQELANEALIVTTESEVATRNAQLQAEALDSAGIASSLPTRSQVQNFDAAQQQKEGSVDDFAQKASAIESCGNDDGSMADKMETDNDDAKDEDDKDKDSQTKGNSRSTRKTRSTASDQPEEATKTPPQSIKKEKGSKSKNNTIGDSTDQDVKSEIKVEIKVENTENTGSVRMEEDNTHTPVNPGDKEEEGNIKQENKVDVKVKEEEEEEELILKDDTEDIDDVVENAHFDTRQSFLDLCLGNHYQFDQLRRSKHTSMMVLYHLFNPDAPKFVPICHLCGKDILQGYRYSCETCDQDWCERCYRNSGGGYRVHQHPLTQISVTNGQQPTQLTPEQRLERKRSIELHLQLLQHAATCNECSSRNCLKMKEFLKHDQNCKIRVAKGCPLCKRIHSILQLHARSCRNDACQVPNCAPIKDQMRQQANRQQLLDDRRRALMNETYGSEK